jgi:hypothetical protein
MLILVLMGCPGSDTGEETAAPVACDESESGAICTWAGTDEAGYNGEHLDRRESWLYFPLDVEFSEFGPPTILDWNNHRIRVVEDDGTLTTIVGTHFVGDGPPDLSDRTPPGAPGTTVNLNHPTDVTWLPDGTMINSSWHTHKLRSYDPATGLVYVYAGSTPGFAGDDDEALSTAKFDQPKAAVYDERYGTLYVLDMRNERIRAITAAGTIHTIAGTGEKGFGGDGGDCIDAVFAFPKGENPRPGGAVALDGTLLYVADTENHRIRRIDLVTGLIDTVVGTGTAGSGGDGGPASAAELNFPSDIEVEGGVLYIADTDNNRVRAVDLDTLTIETIAGTGTAGSGGDGGPAEEAELFGPTGVEVDETGAVYIADSFNHRIRRVAP